MAMKTRKIILILLLYLFYNNNIFSLSNIEEGQFPVTIRPDDFLTSYVNTYKDFPIKVIEYKYKGNIKKEDSIGRQIWESFAFRQRAVCL